MGDALGWSWALRELTSAVVRFTSEQTRAGQHQAIVAFPMRRRWMLDEEEVLLGCRCAGGSHVSNVHLFRTPAPTPGPALAFGRFSVPFVCCVLHRLQFRLVRCCLPRRAQVCIIYCRVANTHLHVCKCKCSVRARPQSAEILKRGAAGHRSTAPAPSSSRNSRRSNPPLRDLHTLHAQSQYPY